MTRDEKAIKIKGLSDNNQQLKRLAEEAEGLDVRLLNLENQAKDLRESIKDELAMIKDSVKEIKGELAQNRYATNRLIKDLLSHEELQQCFFDLREFSESSAVTESVPTLEISSQDLKKVSSKLTAIKPMIHKAHILGNDVRFNQPK